MVWYGMYRRSSSSLALDGKCPPPNLQTPRGGTKERKKKNRNTNKKNRTKKTRRIISISCRTFGRNKIKCYSTTKFSFLLVW